MWNWIYQFWPWLLGALDLVIKVVVTVHIVLWKRDNRAALGWAGLVWVAPFVGSILYFLFGINRIQRKATSIRVRKSRAGRVRTVPISELAEQRAQLWSGHPGFKALETLGRRLTGRPVVGGNQIDPLVNGDATFPAMLEAIDAAERSISLMSYIFDNDRAGNAIFDALVRARDRGVEVRVLCDDVGARYSRPSMLKRLNRAGITARGFLPTRIRVAFKYANLRNHRKILVVDGRIGFTGGTNIREGHWLSLNPGFPVQCIHFRMDGPIVGQLQDAFALDWAFVTGELLDGEQWFPALTPTGTVWARGIPEGPDEDFETISDTILGALGIATRKVRIVTPYFLPHTPIIHALNVAAMRGVDVRVYIPELNNFRLVQWAAMAQLWQILEKGCRVFLTVPPFDHSKLFTVDSAWALVGSSNWDPRSLRLNFEYDVECYDEALATSLEQVVQQKEDRAREITLEDVDSRAFLVRLRDGTARLATPYL